jgi:hypothetical protein
MGWEAYFETLFERIDRKVLDEDKAKYQGELLAVKMLFVEADIQGPTKRKTTSRRHTRLHPAPSPTSSPPSHTPQ